MGLQERSKKRIFRQLCRAEEIALTYRKPDESCSSALLGARSMVAKDNNISLAILRRISDEGVSLDWSETDEGESNE